MVSVIQKIKKWLEEEDIKFSTVKEPYLDFRFEIKEPNQSIFSSNDKPDSIEFGTYSSLDEEYKKAFVALKDNKEKLKILCDLEHSLLEINVGHKLTPNHKNLERIEIYKKIYFDGLTKDKFMDTIFALQRGTTPLGRIIFLSDNKITPSLHLEPKINVN